MRYSTLFIRVAVLFSVLLAALLVCPPSIFAQPATSAQPATAPAPAVVAPATPAKCDTDNPCSDATKICVEEKCVNDPCGNLLCGTEEEPAFGCSVAAALHFGGMVELEQMREFAFKVEKKSDGEARFAAINQKLSTRLDFFYWAAFSYLPLTSKSDVKKTTLCDLLGETMTRLDGVHLMGRIRSHDVALRKLAPPAPKKP